MSAEVGSDFSIASAEARGQLRWEATVRQQESGWGLARTVKVTVPMQRDESSSNKTE